jgi:putative alpha-1,2-mannosidase
MEFSHPVAAMQVSVDGKISSASVGDRLSGEQMKAIFSKVPGSEPLILRIGISGTSIEGARKNLAAEIPRWDFDAGIHQRESSWNKTLAILDAELPGTALSQTFYTGAYHGLTAPATFNDVDGTYRGQGSSESFKSRLYKIHHALYLGYLSWRISFPHAHATLSYE